MNISEMTVARLIERFDLIKHPEGGYYTETYRSEALLAKGRPVATAIYFLLESNDFSALHRLKSDEIWHFYGGSSLTIHIIEQSGAYTYIRLGSDIERGEVFQGVIRAGSWFGAEVNRTDSWSFVGCTVAPGFTFDDFELGKREELLVHYPEHRKLIERFTR